MKGRKRKVSKRKLYGHCEYQVKTNIRFCENKSPLLSGDCASQPTGSNLDETCLVHPSMYHCRPSLCPMLPLLGYVHWSSKSMSLDISPRNRPPPSDPNILLVALPTLRIEQRDLYTNQRRVHAPCLSAYLSAWGRWLHTPKPVL